MARLVVTVFEWFWKAIEEHNEWIIENPEKGASELAERKLGI